ncbi:MAG: carbohydrate ABC transporter permease [Chloroflexota bacterium]|nr:carbohydrate ABC transporter permease [Chloroflexota bacterium]
MPAYVLVVTALKPFKDVSLATMWDLPRGLDFGSFTAAWARVAPNFFNSVQIAVPAAIITAIVGSMNGYIFAKWRFKYDNIVFLLVLFGIFLPYQGILIPLVLMLQRIGLYGTIAGLVLAHTVFAIPITAVIFRSAFSAIPTALVEAAKLEGAGFFRIYSRVMAPLALPAFAVVLIWQFTSAWNDFLIGVVVLNNPRLAPVTVAVQNLAGTYFVEWNIQMAGAVIAALPTVVLYLALGRLFMRGALAGALKG